MPLVELEPLRIEAGIPPDVLRFLREADQRIEDFQVWSRVPAFVPCDFEGTYRQLRSLADSNLTRGMRFCEWGSGFGVAACLAALVGFDSCGIEIDGELVSHAQQLADDFEIEVEFVRGSFIPRGGEQRVHDAGNYSWFTTDSDSAYEELDLDADDMDVIFAYSWPDEELVVGELFDRYAGVGAMLMSYHGGDEFRYRRKKAKRSSFTSPKRRRGATEENHHDGADAIRTHSRHGRCYSTRIIGDFTDEEFLVRPVPAANHAAWQLGHLHRFGTRMVRASCRTQRCPNCRPASPRPQSGPGQERWPGRVPHQVGVLNLFEKVRSATIDRRRLVGPIWTGRPRARWPASRRNSATSSC